MQVEVDSADQRVETLVSTLPTLLSQNAFIFFPTLLLYLVPAPANSFSWTSRQLTRTAPRWDLFGRKRKNFFSSLPSLSATKAWEQNKMTGRDSVARSTFLQKTRFAVLDATACIEKC